MRTSSHHQPEAQHPKSPAIHKIADRLPHLSARSGHRDAKAAITDTGLLSIREIIERYE
jgi:hypothetical protein